MNQPLTPSTTTSASHESPPGSLRVEDQPFAVVPEWVIDSEISDAAFRVYSLLLRFGNTSGQRMPSRKLLAVRLHRSVDAVDRAVRELADHGLLRVEHRRAGRRNLTNRYHLTTRPPGPTTTPDGGGRTSAPPPTLTVAALVRGGWPQMCGPTQRRRPNPLLPPPPPREPPSRRSGGRRKSSPAAASPTSTRWSSTASPPGDPWGSRPDAGLNTPCSPRSSSPSPAAGPAYWSSRRCWPWPPIRTRGRRCGWPKPAPGGHHPRPTSRAPGRRRG